jgi:hypothetical protein
MLLAASLCLFLQASTPAAPTPPKSPWAHVQFLVGEWSGESDGQPGNGTVVRTYRFVLGDKFLHEQNISTYPPQPKNEKGEVHEHWSLFSHDKARHTLVLRQFHQEGFVNQYAMLAGSPQGTVVFESEALENVGPRWKARETYQVVSPDEFVETFELASGGGAYEVYSKARFRRVRPGASVGQTPGKPEASPTVVFVCEHGTVKSLIAREWFNRLAAKRGLGVRAVSRGVTPEGSVPPAIAGALRSDGFDVSSFEPRALRAADATGAVRIVGIGVDLRSSRERGDAPLDTWEGIPPASESYAGSRDALRARIEGLLDTLERAVPRR